MVYEVTRNGYLDDIYWGRQELEVGANGGFLGT